MAEALCAMTYSEKRILAGLRGLRDSNEFCDVTIVVRGQAFRAHKNILALSSDYFRTAFRDSHYFKESAEGRLELHGVSKRIFGFLLDFMYNKASSTDLVKSENPVDLKFTLDEMKDLLRVTDMLLIGSFVEDYKCLIKEKQRAAPGLANELALLLDPTGEESQKIAETVFESFLRLGNETLYNLSFKLAKASLVFYTSKGLEQDHLSIKNLLTFIFEWSRANPSSEYLIRIQVCSLLRHVPFLRIPTQILFTGNDKESFAKLSIQIFYNTPKNNKRSSSEGEKGDASEYEDNPSEEEDNPSEEEDYTSEEEDNPPEEENNPSEEEGDAGDEEIASEHEDVHLKIVSNLIRDHCQNLHTALSKLNLSLLVGDFSEGRVRIKKYNFTRGIYESTRFLSKIGRKLSHFCAFTDTLPSEMRKNTERIWSILHMHVVRNVVFVLNTALISKTSSLYQVMKFQLGTTSVPVYSKILSRDFPSSFNSSKLIFSNKDQILVVINDVCFVISDDDSADLRLNKIKMDPYSGEDILLNSSFWRNVYRTRKTPSNNVHCKDLKLSCIRKIYSARASSENTIIAVRNVLYPEYIQFVDACLTKGSSAFQLKSLGFVHLPVSKKHLIGVALSHPSSPLKLQAFTL